MSDDLPWPGRPRAVAPVIAALGALVRGRRRRWRDDTGRTGPCGIAFFVRELPRYLWFRSLDTTARLCAALLAATARPPAPDPRDTTGDGPVAVVLPVLPDLSHTFVYREVLAALRQDPSLHVVHLEHGQNAPKHPEAVALGQHSTPIAPHGVTRRYVAIFAWMLRAPRRTGQMLALYGQRSGGLFGKLPLRDPRHPGRCFELASALRSTRPRHIHVYGSTYAANAAMGAAILLDVPFSISSYVDFDFDYAFKMLDDKVRLARFFRVCTGFCRQRLAELTDLPGNARVPVLVWGLDVESWNGPASLPREGRLFTAARLVEKKGLHVVPAALARLAAEGVTFSWRIAGDGPERARIEALVAEHGLADRVAFLGPLPNDRVREELRRTDVALLPCVVAADGERDGIPIFLTEAMATGVPVLTTGVSGIPELIRDGENGFLAAPGDPDDLARRLGALLADPEHAEAVARRGREDALRTQDAAASAAELLAWIDGREPAP